MPLVKSSLKSGIKGALETAAGMEESAAEAREALASQIADAIHNYVKAADVNAGIPVSTTGTATEHTGQTIAKGSLS